MAYGVAGHGAGVAGAVGGHRVARQPRRQRRGLDSFAVGRALVRGSGRLDRDRKPERRCAAHDQANRAVDHPGRHETGRCVEAAHDRRGAVQVDEQRGRGRGVAVRGHGHGPGGHGHRTREEHERAVAAHQQLRSVRTGVHRQIQRPDDAMGGRVDDAQHPAADRHHAAAVGDEGVGFPDAAFLRVRGGVRCGGSSRRAGCVDAIAGRRRDDRAADLAAVGARQPPLGHVGTGVRAQAVQQRCAAVIRTEQHRRRVRTARPVGGASRAARSRGRERRSGLAGAGAAGREHGRERARQCDAASSVQRAGSAAPGRAGWAVGTFVDFGHDVLLEADAAARGDAVAGAAGSNPRNRQRTVTVSCCPARSR